MRIARFEIAVSAAAADRVLERHRFVRLPVEVDGGDFAGRGDLAGFGVAHLVQEADRFFADFQQSAADLDDVAGEQFALVG